MRVLLREAGAGEGCWNFNPPSRHRWLATQQQSGGKRTGINLSRSSAAGCFAACCASRVPSQLCLTRASQH